MCEIWLSIAPFWNPHSPQREWSIYHWWFISIGFLKLPCCDDDRAGVAVHHVQSTTLWSVENNGYVDVIKASISEVAHATVTHKLLVNLGDW